MRRILTTGLLVSTILAMAVPATAQNRDNRERGAENGGQRESAPARAEQAARPAPQRAPSAVQTRPVPPSGPGGVAQRPPVNRPSPIPGANNPANPANPNYGNRVERPNPSRPQAQPPRYDGNRPGNRPGTIPGANNPANPGSPRYNANRGPNRGPGYSAQGRLQDRQRWTNQQRWSNNWRNDRRYDWQSYRNQHRSIYRMPSYRAPYGWNRGYSRFAIGGFLSNLLFDQSYWINDPAYYRLPPAYGSLRWVRYYDDALLVDIRDGYVVDVIDNFFW